MRPTQIPITHDLLNLIAEIDEFKGRWSAQPPLSPERLGRLRRVATIESVGSSTRIEGARLTDAEVETLLADLSMLALENRDQQEVAGYAEAIDLVLLSYGDITITGNHIRQLHQILLRHSGKDERHPGAYKSLPNPVVALDAEGRQIAVLLETASPFETPGAMADLVAWTNQAVAERSLHPLLIIAVFVVTFLAIHPFQDGNGRLSRILTTLLLLRAGYVYVPYASLERIIEANQEIYYRALRRTQATLKQDQPDWQPWFGFFLRCLKQQITDLGTKLAADPVGNSPDAALPSLSLAILAAFDRRDRLTMADLIAATGANPNTLKVRLRELVAAGRIRRHGRARATWYSRTP